MINTATFDEETLIRTKREGSFAVKTNPYWGSYLAKVDDPLANAEAVTQSFELIPDFPKIPKELWSALVKLYFDYCTEKSRTTYGAYGTTNTYNAYGNGFYSYGRELEVSCLLLRDKETGTKWKILIPEQEVTVASVRVQSFSKSIDLITGEEYTQFPPEGYVHAGSSHSHNSMSCTFSSIDDANELTVPGMHILVRSINKAANTYAVDVSVVQGKVRYLVDAKEAIDLTPDGTATYDPKVKEYIKTTSLWQGKRKSYTGFSPGYTGGKTQTSLKNSSAISRRNKEKFPNPYDAYGLYDGYDYYQDEYPGFNDPFHVGKDNTVPGPATSPAEIIEQLDTLLNELFLLNYSKEDVIAYVEEYFELGVGA